MPNLLVHLVLAALVWAGASFWTPGQCQEARARQAAFSLQATRDADETLRLRWTIAAGTYLYRDRMAAATPGGESLPLITPAGETKDDPNFGPTEVYHDAATATLPGAALAKRQQVRITYQGCAEQGICFPPVTQTLDLAALPQTAGANGAAGAASSESVAAAPSPEAARPGIAETSPVSLLGGSLAGVLAAMFGLGLLLAFTPCVLPMVPILSGILARSGQALTAGRGLVLSGSYVLAMAAAYASLGLAAAWLGQNLQVALQTPLALSLMALVLVALAVSMFGVFDLQAPRWWRERAGAVGPAPGRGSVGGAALMGFGSALIVGPCVTPPLAAALLYVAQTGDVARGAAALFALGLGMGAPLVLVGIFGARILPRSGAWLVRIKHAFGFVFLGLAVSLVARLLPETLTLLVWGTLALGLGLSVAVLIAAGTQTGIGRTARVVAIGCVCAVLGAAIGGSDPIRLLPGVLSRDAMATRTATTSTGLDAVLQNARAEGKPVLVEFAADWCSVCKSNERTVLADAGIRERLKAVSVIRADVTRDDAEARALMQRFDVVGPPTLILFRADGTEARDARTVGALSADDLKRRLALIGA